MCGVICLTFDAAHIRRLRLLLMAAHANSPSFLALVVATQTLTLRNSVPILAGFTACDTAQRAPMETMRANAVLLAKLSYERAG
jgi:hypothetical protein